MENIQTFENKKNLILKELLDTLFELDYNIDNRIIIEKIEEKNEDKIFKEKSFKFDNLLKEYQKQIKFNSCKNNFYIFHKYYNLKENNNKNSLINKLSQILYFTYRKNFPIIYNNMQKKYTSDNGWGCMIRCGQMIMCRALFKYFKFIYFKNIYKSLFKTIQYFLEIPFDLKDLPLNLKPMINKYSKSNNKKILKIYPPFSIKSICKMGEYYDKTAGKWFSDVNLVNIFKSISEYFELFKDLKILNFQNSLNIKDVLNNNFEEIENSNSNECFEFNKKYYKLNKVGIIFVSCRIGLNSIAKEYYETIKKIFSCKNCIGIIGGRLNLAYYFIGYNNEKNELLYLDPHTTNKVVDNLDTKNFIKNYIIKEIHCLKIEKLVTAFTIGFIFRNIQEFKNLYSWLLEYTKNEYSCFSLNDLVDEEILNNHIDLGNNNDF